MSLDVYLTVKEPILRVSGSGIFVRDGAATREITIDEWNRLHPDMPAIEQPPSECRTTQVYESNITHNLNRMAAEAGIYYCLWRPEDIGITKACQLIKRLGDALILMRQDPERFKQFNAPNGWGLYEHFVPWIEEYLNACIANPDADVSVSR